MDLQTVLLVISIVILSIIMLILLAAIMAIFIIRKKIKQIPIAKLGGLTGILTVIRFILGRRHATRR